ncbi:hypothetical protein GCM10007094_13130 [Pseudovibrio japonicus]|uniref:Uncharacterized protein n=1 Tax=Pseudovibrio japonicus TaxID=366534 RepID=A0ABQ3E4M4_9HYPH|nr:hypothetical protein GCM10007094_13130 [Pseudovibrio japonicus]
MTDKTANQLFKRTNLKVSFGVKGRLSSMKLYSSVCIFITEYETLLLSHATTTMLHFTDKNIPQVIAFF